MPKPPHSKSDPMSREVDRLLAGLARPGTPAEPDPRPRSTTPARGVPAARRAPRAARGTEALSRGELTALWARIVLGVLLGGMMTQWPYPHGCGWPLGEYLGAVAVVVLAGGWIASVSWQRRHAPVHVLALLLTLWGIALATYQILPRVGYAAERWSWQCSVGSTGSTGGNDST